MKIYALLVVSICLVGEETATHGSSTVDSNSRYGRTERLQSINGRLLPLERVEEHVIRNDSSARAVERIIQRFDQDGHLMFSEKSLIEERKGPEGPSSIRTTKYETGVNGHEQIAERSMTEIHRAGTTERAETLVERPTVNGSFDLFEKSSVVKTKSGNGFRQDATTYRNGVNGFYEALRVVTDHTQQGASTREQITEYEIGSSGVLELHLQKARISDKHPDGSETEVVDWFGSSVPGVASTSGSGLRLTERETIERVGTPDGSSRETSRVQRPLLSDPKVLGPSAVTSDIICRGKCHQ